MTNLSKQMRSWLNATDVHDKQLRSLRAMRHEHALRAVLDVHQADEYGYCTGCGIDSGENPILHDECDTVRAIAHELRVDQ